MASNKNTSITFTNQFSIVGFDNDDDGQTNTMYEKELTFDKFTEDASFLYMLTVANSKKLWPKRIETFKGTYEFSSRLAVPVWGVGFYNGYAKYVKV